MNVFLVRLNIDTRWIFYLVIFLSLNLFVLIGFVYLVWPKSLQIPELGRNQTMLYLKEKIFNLDNILGLGAPLLQLVKADECVERVQGLLVVVPVGSEG